MTDLLELTSRKFQDEYECCHQTHHKPTEMEVVQESLTDFDNSVTKINNTQIIRIETVRIIQFSKKKLLIKLNKYLITDMISDIDDKALADILQLF